MIIGYEKYLGEIKDSKVKTALRLTFDKAFTSIVDEYDHRTRVNVFGCFIDLLRDVRTRGVDKDVIEGNPFYKVYAEFCDMLFGWIEESLEKCTIYDVLEKVAEEIVIASTAEGLTDGSISPEEVFG